MTAFKINPTTEKSVLLIEDETELLRMYSETMEHIGNLNITSCKDLKEAKEHLLKNKFDLIVTDWMLNGHTVDSILFNDPHVTPHLPEAIIIVTGYYDAPSFNKNLSKKYAVLIKPFSLDELSNKILKLINE